MRRYVPVALDVGAHPGSEPWQYMVVYEFDSEQALRNFTASETLAAMTRDYEVRFGGAGRRVRFTYRQVFPWGSVTSHALLSEQLCQPGRAVQAAACAHFSWWHAVPPICCRHV